MVTESSTTEDGARTDPRGEDRAEDEARGHPAGKIALRFGCIYLVWLVLWFPPAFLQPNAVSRGFDRLAAWVGENLLGLEAITTDPTGSGDMTLHWVGWLVMMAVSLAGSLLWTLRDRGRRHDRRLGRWVVVVCRYYLLTVMLGYGFAKIFAVQFPAPSLERLLQPYGDSSPMGLLWTFMGFSRPYSVFAGLGEVVGGLLLGLRRTTTLGALIVAGVMSNVVVMNFAYDVPVKLFSCHLLLLALVLVALDRRRLLAVLVRNHPAPAAVFTPHFESRRGRLAGRVAKALYVGFLLFVNVARSGDFERAWGHGATKPPLWGIYDVQSFALDGEALPPLLTDARRWQTVVFDTRQRLTVRTMDGELHRYGFAVEGAKKLKIYADGDARLAWTWERPSPGTLAMAGELDGGQVAIELQARDPATFPLLARGFHWINEEPFNR